MNRQLLKVETSYNQTTHNQTIQSKHKDKNKNKFRKFKENYQWKKDYLTITKKLRMENSQNGNGKNKSSTNVYINN